MPHNSSICSFHPKTSNALIFPTHPLARGHSPWPLPVHRLRVSACKLSPNCLTSSGSLLRRLVGSNQCMQTSLSPSSVHAHLCFMPLLILYVFSASHPTSEQGSSHSSRTYSNEASSKTLDARYSGACPEEQLFGGYDKSIPWAQEQEPTPIFLCRKYSHFHISGDMCVCVP